MSKHKFDSEMLEFFTVAGLLKSLNGELSLKMLEYLRDKIKLLPHAIKISTGRGILGLYSENVVKFMKRVIAERHKGCKFGEIKDRFNNDIERLFSETEFWRNYFNSYRQVRTSLLGSLKASDHPHLSFKIDYEKCVLMGIQEIAGMDNLRKELEAMFKKWDGSLDSLAKIKNKIKEFESTEISKKIISKGGISI
ncbi:MAG: hypothetical protein M0R20_01380 [Candidatus Omnitrophica bacterium]|jgi:hypothetical protein|nr:hypothetical protein [Candidatus Omnitrophota bacterium]